jgi:ubiquitin carboxyl-terminal hydrolase L3
MGKKWLPLESNPAVLNDFAEKIGMTDASYRFCDVFGLDPVRADGHTGNLCSQ